MTSSPATRPVIRLTGWIASAVRRDVRAAADIGEPFGTGIGGGVADRDHLRGKPAPGSCLAGTCALDLDPPGAAVSEDTVVGVAAGRAGGFGWVVGVYGMGLGDALRQHGADAAARERSQLLETR